MYTLLSAPPGGRWGVVGTLLCDSLPQERNETGEMSQGRKWTALERAAEIERGSQATFPLHSLKTLLYRNIITFTDHCTCNSIRARGEFIVIFIKRVTCESPDKREHVCKTWK